MKPTKEERGAAAWKAYNKAMATSDEAYDKAVALAAGGYHDAVALARKAREKASRDAWKARDRALRSHPFQSARETAEPLEEPMGSSGTSVEGAASASNRADKPSPWVPPSDWWGYGT